MRTKMLKKTILNIIDRYKYHPSIIKITKNNCSEVLHSFKFQQTNEKEVYT